MRSSLPALLPLGDRAPTPDVLIVVELVDGTARADLVHLPAASKRVPCKGERRAFVDVHMPEAPYEWVSVCGVEGVVYAKGGPFSRSPVCAACEVAVCAPVPIRPPPAVEPKPRRATVPHEVLEPVKTDGPGRATTWTQERVIDAIQRWAVEHDGDPPLSGEWEVRGAYWPGYRTVFERFGSWNAAIRAAGFRPRSRGRWGHLEDAA